MKADLVARGAHVRALRSRRLKRPRWWWNTNRGLTHSLDLTKEGLP